MSDLTDTLRAIQEIKSERYVGTEEKEDDGIPFEEKMKELNSEHAKQMEEGAKLDEEIKKRLESIGFKVE